MAQKSTSPDIHREYTGFFPFCGIGGFPLGFQKATVGYKGLTARFRISGAVDNDLGAIENFRLLTGASATCMDLFSRKQYIDFHGKEPPADWREATPEDILAAAGGEYPDIVVTSPPCKGFSGLLPSKAAASRRYQALNRLSVRGVEMTLCAFKPKLPAVYLFENVPRITTRGKELLDEIKSLFTSFGYVYDERIHDCGEIGALGQRRKRYLLIARHKERVPNFIYMPRKFPLKSIGDVLGPLPMPDDPAGGEMHRLPRLKWLTWLRLALIRAGGDWRDLEKIAPKEYRLEHIPRAGVYKVQEWDNSSSAIVGAGAVGKSNGASCIADPRIGCSSRPNLFGVAEWGQPISIITGSPSVTSSNGVATVADPRFTCKMRGGNYEVQH